MEKGEMRESREKKTRSQLLTQKYVAVIWVLVVNRRPLGSVIGATLVTIIFIRLTDALQIRWIAQKPSDKNPSHY